MAASSALLLLLTLLSPPAADAWLNDITFIVPAKQEQPGAVAQTVSLDCAASGAPIFVASATYGAPCAPSMTPCKGPGGARARSYRRIVLPLTRFILKSLAHSAPLHEVV